MILGIAFIITFAISVGAIIQRNHVTIGLVILNWVLILDALGVIIVGSFVWFITLRERAYFHSLWDAQTRENRILLQDQVSYAISMTMTPDFYSIFVAQMLWLLQLDRLC
jgi:hypothetical protein